MSFSVPPAPMPKIPLPYSHPVNSRSVQFSGDDYQDRIQSLIRSWQNAIDIDTNLLLSLQATRALADKVLQGQKNPEAQMLLAQVRTLLDEQIKPCELRIAENQRKIDEYRSQLD